METQRIELTKEKETLLVPLFAKAIESGENRPIIDDPKAAEILDAIDYDFGELRIPRQTLLTLAMRAKQLDSYVLDYLARTEHPLVIHLGCGLDSRVLRVNHRAGSWYDLDFPDVIELRRRFYAESSHYHMIGSSVTDFAWTDRISETGPACIIAEGLLMYLAEQDIRGLFARLAGKWPGSELAFDAYSTVTARSAGRHPSLKKTGAVVRWGIDDPKSLESWAGVAAVSDEWYFTDSADIRGLGPGTRLLFGIAKRFRAARRAHRVIRIRL